MKRWLKIAAVLAALCTLASAAEKALEQLKAEVASAKPKDQPKLYSEIAEQELKQAEALFAAGDSQKGNAAILETVQDCERAAKTSLETRKRLKETEISLRKMSERMENLAKGVEFESRDPIKSGIERVEQARSTLLNAMFK
jgi:hypothetical protein